MKERPILFSGEMVRAILDGRKTQTRRIIKPQPIESMINPPAYEDGEIGDIYLCPDLIFPDTNVFVERTGHGAYHNMGSVQFAKKHCKYGQPGDRLWVRESYRIGAWDEECEVFALDYCDGAVKQWLTPSATETEDSGEVFERIWISCCDELSRKGIEPEDDGQYRWMPGESPLNWKPSIHMPRWASRITLEITGVRVERLQDISEDDALSEGLASVSKYGSLFKHGIPDFDGLPGNDNVGWSWVEWDSNPISAYKKLWESINGKGSWEENQWVWVITFRRVMQGGSE